MAMAMARVRVRGRAAAVAVARVSVILVLVGLLLPGNGLRVDVPESVASVHGFLRALQESLPPPSVQESAARSVLQRLLPSHNSSFQFRILPQNACEGKSCFQISNLRSAGDPEISIAATSGVELCAGLHWYLKNWCGVHISWKKTGGAQLASVPPPSALPRVNSDGIEVSRSVPWNYYQNVVTSSYSYVWWDWPRWELEIDWMALQGINLPLAFTGQETIWRNVFLSERFNLSSEDLNGFFGGPAFLAWARMGNLHGWGGPLAKPWLDQQLALQKRILERMRQLGMTPVLPAFSGNVPFALKKVFPSAKITQLGDWNTVNGDKRWCCTYLLDPTDPLFVEIGKSFVQEQIKEYGGTSHIYNCDTFNENEPPSSDPSYISSLGAAVFTAMQAGDKDAIWLMQGWLFSSDSQFWHPPQMQALLHSVPRGKMVVLDLFAEVKPVWKYSNHFYGTPYIWCMLHNFGGNIEMYGSLSNVSAGPIEARTSLGSTMVGVGMCMEGIEHNPVVYDLMAEMAFHDEKVITKEWIQSYSTRRYGKHTVGTQEAWDILYQTIYECKDGIADHNTDVIVKFPDENPDSLNLMAVPGHLWYQNMDAVKALNSLLKSASILKNVSTYRYDVADLTRQVLAKHGNELYYHILTSYQSKNFKRMRKFGNIFLELILDIDTLLQSNECFLLGSWLESAKALATNENENRLYEWNARTQVTMWYDNTVDTPSNLHDYANKYWSGLIKDYYYARASLYLQLLEESAEQNSSFPFNTWRRRWTSLTNSWQTARDSYALTAEGDTIQIARSLLWKYFKVHAKPEESYVFDL